MELIEGIARIKEAADEVHVKLITSENTDGEEKVRKQLENLLKVQKGAEAAGIKFDVALDDTIHDRSIVTDTGWKIVLGRGLDIFQFVSGDAFDLAGQAPGVPPSQGVRGDLHPPREWLR
jgi:ATP-dependent Lon protease